MMNFLNKMKSDLGVQPEALLQAFSELSPEDLLLPPEQSLVKVVDNLDLNQDQSVLAERYFQEMLGQTQNHPLSSYLGSSENELSIRVLSKKDLQNEQIQKNVEKLSQNFFVHNSKRNSAQELSQTIQNSPVVEQSSDKTEKESMPFFLAGSAAIAKDGSSQKDVSLTSSAGSTSDILSSQNTNGLDLNSSESSFNMSSNSDLDTGVAAGVVAGSAGVVVEAVVSSFAGLSKKDKSSLPREKMFFFSGSSVVEGNMTLSPIFNIWFTVLIYINGLVI